MLTGAATTPTLGQQEAAAATATATSVLLVMSVARRYKCFAYSRPDGIKKTKLLKKRKKE
jgi:hypothetical protein